MVYCFRCEKDSDVPLQPAIDVNGVDKSNLYKVGHMFKMLSEQINQTFCG